MRNILSNALKFTPNCGKIEVKVKILHRANQIKEKSQSAKVCTVSGRSFLGVKIAPEISASVDRSSIDLNKTENISAIPLSDFVFQSLIRDQNEFEPSAVRVRVEVYDTGDGIATVSLCLTIV